MTHRMLRKTANPREEFKRIRIAVETAVRKCYDIAIVLLKKDCLSHGQFEDVFNPQLEEIMTCAFKLASTLKEDVVTKNFVSYYPLEGDRFNEQTMVVEDEEAGLEEFVGCTTRLGMEYTCKPARENTAKLTKSFVKAQVVATSAVKEMVPDSEQ